VYVPERTSWRAGERGMRYTRHLIARSRTFRLGLAALRAKLYPLHLGVEIYAMGLEEGGGHYR